MTNADTKITTYLEMTDPEQLQPKRVERDDLEIRQIEQPAPEFSWFLHQAVGAAHRWGGRETWGAHEWKAHVDRPELETWVLRLVGLAMMAIGLAWLFKIFATVIDRIPFVGIHIGTLVELGTSLIAILIALPLALLTIAIAWFFVRPVLSIVLLVLGVGGFFGLRKYGNK